MNVAELPYNIFRIYYYYDYYDGRQWIDVVFCTFSVFFAFSILENERENVRRTQRGRITIDGICAYKYALNPMLRKQVDVGGCMLASAVKWLAPHE